MSGVYDLKAIGAQYRENLNWIVIPLRAKVPTVEKWNQFSIEDSEIIDDNLWNSADGIGIVTHPSNLLVLDIDILKEKDKGKKEDGMIWWEGYIKMYGEPNTYTVRSGGGGFHYYFNFNERVAHLTRKISCLTNEDTGLPITWDIISTNSYIVAPPSFHPITGERYTQYYNAPVAEMDDWLLELLTKHHTNSITPGTVAKVATPIPLKLVVKPNTNNQLKDYHIRAIEVFNQHPLSKQYDVGKLNQNGSIVLLRKVPGFCTAHNRYHDSNNAYLNVKGKMIYLTCEADPVAHILIGTLNPHDEYNPYDNYYFINFLREVSGKTYESEGELLTDVRDKLYRIIKLIPGINTRIFLKQDPNNLFYSSDKKSLQAIQRDNYVFYKKKTYDDKGKEKIEIESMHVLAPIYEDRYIYVRNTSWKPYHEYKPLLRNIDELNIFPGFQVRINPNFKIEDLVKIQPILDHIKFCWADGNDDYYRYILSWHAYPLIKLTKTKVVLVFIGDFGCGKSILFDGIARYIYGDNLSHQYVGLEKLVQRFNSPIINTMYIAINELDNADSQKAFLAQFETLKDLITCRKSGVELKNVNIGQDQDNHLNLAIASNHKVPVKVYKGDRRFGLFDCSNKFIGNKPYFDKLYECITQESFNILCSYLLSDHFKPLFIDDLERRIPATEARQRCMILSKDKIEEFYDDIMEGEIVIANEYIQLSELKSHDKVFMTCPDIYKLYTDWLSQVTNGKGMAKYKNAFFTDFKLHSKLMIPDKIYINGKQERCYTFDKQSYDKCLISKIIQSQIGLSINKRITLRKYIDESLAVLNKPVEPDVPIISPTNQKVIAEFQARQQAKLNNN